VLSLSLSSHTPGPLSSHTHRICSLRSTYTFCIDYTVTGSLYSSVFC
jgi:hypothetical protein